MATYNWATVLPFSIGSALDQTFKDFELLVVGDGCTDESADVVASFRDPRVHWINLPHNTGHQSGPNNEGQRHARGDIVAYLGHDDLWLPNHLEILVEAIEGGAPAAHTSVLNVHPYDDPVVTPPDGWVFTPGQPIAPSSMALARNVLLETGGWRSPRETGRWDPETDLWTRVNDIAGPPVWIPHLTCVKLPAAKRRNVYRTRPNSEQAHWLRTIREAPDPELAVRATANKPYVLAQKQRPVALPTRAWRSMQFRLRKRLGIGPRYTQSTTRIRRNRRFKGL